MKMRIGFVSNSSSSSFAIFGYEIDDYTLPEDTEGCDSEYIEELIKRLGLKNVEVTMGSSYSDTLYIGLSPQKMLKTETRAEFEARIRKDMEILAPELKIKKTIRSPEFYCEGWYDG